MRAFALVAPRTLAWVEKPRPVCGPFDAIIRPTVIAPCTSDVHNVYDHDAPRAPEFVFGHECVGEIVEVGSFVRDFRPGDKVIVPAATPNWRSRGIQDHNFKHPDGPFSSLTIACLQDGEFAEFFAVNDADCNLVHCPDDICDEDAVMATDMIPTGLTGAKIANIRFGDTVCVFGIGPVGLMAVAGARIRGAARIIAIDSRPVCEPLAIEYGATDLVDFKACDVYQEIMRMTGGRGADASIVTGGNAETFGTAVAVTRFGGGTIANMNFYSSGDSVPIPTMAWGSGMSGKNIVCDLAPGGRVTIERVLSLIRYGRISGRKLVTHKFYGFSKIEDAFYLMRDKPADLIKPLVYIDWSKEG